MGHVTLPKVAQASNTTVTKECMVAVTLLYVATIAKPTLATLGDVTQIVNPNLVTLPKVAKANSTTVTKQLMALRIFGNSSLTLPWPLWVI